MEVNAFAGGFNASLVVGKKVAAYSADLFGATLLLESRTVLDFFAEEHSAGHWFEVYTINVQAAPYDRAWTFFPEPRLVESVVLLWQTEWLEEGASGPTLGANPKTQYAGRGPIPGSAVASAHVQAAVLLKCSSGDSIFAAASASSPFRINIAVDRREIAAFLEDFHPIESCEA